jgi:LCP family protein required for cell wall assembly
VTTSSRRRPRKPSEQSPIRPTQRTAGAGLRVLAVVASVVVFAATGYAWATYRTLTTGLTRLDAIGAGATPNVDGADQNILLVGNDDRGGATPAELAQLSTQQDGGSINTDTMMVLHVPANGSKATVISLPRDSWVDIPGFGKGKLNSAYADGVSTGGGDAAGAKLMIQTVENVLGLSIDHYVAVSLLAFYRISLAIGGVPVCLNAAQNATTDSDPYGSGYSGINLPAGDSVISGKQALAFVRQRHGLPRGDLDRIVRQQYFLSHAFAKIASAGTLLNPAELNRLVGAVSASLKVDQGLDLVALAGQVQNLTAGNLSFLTLPTLGTPTITYGGSQVSIVALDFARIPAFVSTVIGQPTVYQKATAAAPSSVTVTIVNAEGTAGLAGRNGTALSRLGFVIGQPETAEATAVSTVEYPRGMEAQAKAVADAVPGVAVAVSSAATGVKLVLGTDRVQVPGAAPWSGRSATPTPAPNAAAPSSPAPSSPAPSAPPTTAPTPNCIN